MNVSLAGISLSWHVVEIQRSLVEENCVELLDRLQASVIRCKASGFLTEIVVEWFPSEAEIILLTAVGFIPEENVLQLGVASVSLPVGRDPLVNVVTKVINYEVSAEFCKISP